MADSLSSGGKEKGKQMNESKKNAYQEVIMEMLGEKEEERFLRNIFVSLRDYLNEKQETTQSERDARGSAKRAQARSKTACEGGASRPNLSPTVSNRGGEMHNLTLYQQQRIL